MKLEDQVCSFELAKHLKELGVIQNSIFTWIDLKNEISCFIYYGSTHCKLGTHYSAFTVAELIEMIPDYDNKDDPRRISFGIEYPEGREEMGGKYYCVSDFVNYPRDTDFRSNNFANCLAELIVHLIKNGIIKIDTQ